MRVNHIEYKFNFTGENRVLTKKKYGVTLASIRLMLGSPTVNISYYETLFTPQRSPVMEEMDVKQELDCCASPYISSHRHLCRNHGACVFVLPSDPLIAARLHEMMHPSSVNARLTFQPDAASKMDAALESSLPDLGAGKEIRASMPPSIRGYLVVGLGDCATCSHFDDKIWQKEAEAAGVPLVGFAGAPKSKIAEFRRILKTGFPIYSDSGNGLHNAVNAYWSGRVYYYDRDWKLVWIMKGFGNPYDLNRQPGLLDLIGGKR